MEAILRTLTGQTSVSQEERLDRFKKEVIMQKIL